MMKSLSKHKIQNDTTSSLHSSAIKYSLRFLFLVLSILNLGLHTIIRKKKLVALAFVPFLLASCSSHKSRQQYANLAANKAGFTPHVIKAGAFWLQTYQKVSNPNLPYIIYIEGDGFAFRTRWEISEDPTPKHPMVLDLATRDYRSNVIYIARPCQYEPILMDHYCNNSYWTTKRMSDEVVNSMNVAIKSLTHNQPVDLIGYSGGGGIAALVASQNKQVRSIVTIAANLDHVAFNQYHKVRPMIGSLNPIDVATKISHIPQMHYTGGEDTIIPAFIADKFVQVSNSPCVHQVIIPKVSHDSGWEKSWNYILSTPVTCEKK